MGEDFTSRQYQLAVDIVRLSVEALHDGMTNQEAIAIVKQATLTLESEAFNSDLVAGKLPFYPFSADARRYRFFRSMRVTVDGGEALGPCDIDTFLDAEQLAAEGG